MRFDLHPTPLSPAEYAALLDAAKRYSGVLRQQALDALWQDTGRAVQRLLGDLVQRRRNRSPTLQCNTPGI